MVNYESPCWGHNCDKYKQVEDLRSEVIKVCERYTDTPIPYLFFLRELGLKKSTPKHWKECCPLNLKILEDVKMYCDESIFNKIKSDPKLVWEYWKLTRLDEEKDITALQSKEDKTFELDAFGDTEEYLKKK